MGDRRRDRGFLEEEMRSGQYAQPSQAGCKTHSDSMLARRVLSKPPSWGECPVALAEGSLQLESYTTLM